MMNISGRKDITAVFLDWRRCSSLKMEDLRKKIGIPDVDFCGPAYCKNDDSRQHVLLEVMQWCEDRGPKKKDISSNIFVANLCTDVCWGDLDYLIDTPPGSIPLDASPTQSQEDGQTLTDMFPNSLTLIMNCMQ